MYKRGLSTVSGSGRGPRPRVAKGCSNLPVLKTVLGPQVAGTVLAVFFGWGTLLEVEVGVGGTMRTLDPAVLL